MGRCNWKNSFCITYSFSHMSILLQHTYTSEFLSIIQRKLQTLGFFQPTLYKNHVNQKLYLKTGSLILWHLKTPGFKLYSLLLQNYAYWTMIILTVNKQFWLIKLYLEKRYQ